MRNFPLKTANNSEKDGYLLLHKNPGLTSFQSLAMIKKALGMKKIGHTGTLDKFAEGLLIVLTGRCTKLIPWFLNCNKSYTGIVQFGTETDTLDPEGKVIKECGIPSREKIEAVIPQFTGSIMQAPPSYSSVHIDGKRAYELAKTGADVEMKKRPVEIFNLQLKKYENGEALIEVACSKGTYIRSLARDLAYASGSCAHLVYLNRTSIAGFSLKEAVNPSTESDPHEAIRKALKPVNRHMFEALHIPCISVDDKSADTLIHGRPIHSMNNMLESALTCTKNNNNNIASASQNTLNGIQKYTNSIDAAVFQQDGSFVGMIKKEHGSWKYGYIYANN